MLVLFESALIYIIGAIIKCSTAIKNPLGIITAYPQSVIKKAKEEDIIKNAISVKSPQYWSGKITSSLFSALIFAALSVFINKADSFVEGTIIAFIILFINSWADAFITGYLFFGHCKKIRIPGTEEMENEYKNISSYLKEGFINTLLGIPTALISGGFNTLIISFMK